MHRFVYEHARGQEILRDPKTRLELVFTPAKLSADNSRLYFVNNCKGHTNSGTSCQPVTGTDTDKMIVPIFKQIEQYAHVVEVGCGLSDLAIRLSEREGSPKVTAIDSADYDTIECMLRYATSHHAFVAGQDRAQTFLERIQQLRTSPNINLVNDTLDNVIKTQPDLKAKANVVVEHAGPAAYAYRQSGQNGTYRHVIALEQVLLKPEGFVLAASGLHVLRFEKRSMTYSKH